jgi:hypothetical protein
MRIRRQANTAKPLMPPPLCGASGTYLERMIITDQSGKVTQLTKKLLLMK